MYFTDFKYYKSPKNVWSTRRNEIRVYTQRVFGQKKKMSYSTASHLTKPIIIISTTVGVVMIISFIIIKNDINLFLIDVSHLIHKVK